MKTTKLLKAAFITLGAVALLACTKRAKEAEPGYGWGDAVFNLEVVSVGESEATLQESATGNDEAPFYGFVTNDISSKVETVIATQMKSITANWGILKTGKPEAVKVTGLRRGGAAYRYVVFGLTPDGRTYGTPAVATFETAGEFKTGQIEVNYLGRDDKKVDSFSVSGATSDWDFAIVARETAAEFGTDKALLNYVLDLSEGRTPKTGDATITYKNLPVGDYYIYVYGVFIHNVYDDKGKIIEELYYPTLQYAKGRFSIEEEVTPPSPVEVTYESYLGTWTDENGQEFEFTEDEAGESYIISGMDVDAVAFYEDGTLAFYTTELGEATVNEDGDTLPIYLVGLDDGNYIEFADQNTPEFLLATGTLSGSTISITGQEYKATYSGTEYDEVIVSLLEIIVDEEGIINGEPGYFNLSKNPVTLDLPATLTKAEGTKAGVRTQSPVDFSAFQALRTRSGKINQ